MSAAIYTPEKIDGNHITAKMFAEVFQAYMECSNAVQEAIREMVNIVNAPDASDEDRAAALDTLVDALFPAKHNGELGADLENVAKHDAEAHKAEIESLDAEETTFVDRVTRLLNDRGMTQGDLAKAIGVGQPAVSMMLSRNCRPQQRTIEKIAKVFQVSPEIIWPH